MTLVNIIVPLTVKKRDYIRVRTLTYTGDLGDTLAAVVNTYQDATRKATAGTDKDSKAETLARDLASQEGCHVLSVRDMDVKHYPVLSHQVGDDGRCVAAPARAMVILDLKADRTGVIAVAYPDGAREEHKATKAGMANIVKAHTGM